MVMINTTINEINSILKKKLRRSDYDELCLKYGIDVSGNDEYLNFEMSSDRTELTSKHAVAFLIGQLIGAGVRRNESLFEKTVDAVIESTHRPFVNLLRVKLNERAEPNIEEFMAIQDKLDKTIGRDRKLAAVGMFDYSRIKFPIRYTETSRENVTFTPLGTAGEKSYAEIIYETEKGRQYSGLLGDKPIVWKQDGGVIFAMPPIINSDFASLTKDTKSILIDITGTDKDAVNSLTKALIFNMQFFGEVTLLKPRYTNKKIDTGIRFKRNTFFLSEKTIENTLGIKINSTEARKILFRLGYEVSQTADGLSVTPPFYRDDIIHQVDVIDDIMRVYGVQNIKSDERRTYTVGKTLTDARKIEIIRDTIVGFGYQELDLNVMTSEQYQFRKTGIKAVDYAPFLGSKNSEATMARANIVPEALRFVSNNLHKKFPQKVFDIGFVVSKAVGADVNFINRPRLCVLSCGADSNMSEMVVILEKLLSETVGGDTLGLSSGEDLDGFSGVFIEGRAGKVHYGGKNIGVLGEVHPRVLNELGIELPASFAEIYLDNLFL